MLEELEISHCPSVSSQRVLSLPSSLKILKLDNPGGLPYRIEGLSLSDFYYSSYVTDITFEAWTSSTLPVLDKLHIQKCESLHDSSGNGILKILAPYKSDYFLLPGIKP